MFLTKSLRTKAAGMAFLLSLTAPAILAAFPAAAKVLATVNGKQITDEDLAIAADDLRASLPPQADEKARDSYVLDYLINSELVAQKALADKADQTPEFAKKMAYYREKLLMESVLEKIAKGAATDAAVKATYDEEIKKQKPETEIHARHILVGTEEEAKTALKRLMGGEEFEKLAKELSKDPGSEGGDLGWFTKDRMVPEFSDAAFKLDVGQVSDPVKSPVWLAYHRDLGQTRENTPAFRSGEGPGEPFCRAKGADGLCDGFAQKCQDRADHAAGSPQNRQAWDPRAGRSRPCSGQEISAADGESADNSVVQRRREAVGASLHA